MTDTDTWRSLGSEHFQCETSCLVWTPQRTDHKLYTWILLRTCWCIVQSPQVLLLSPLKHRILWSILFVLSHLVNSEWSTCFECFATGRWTLVCEGVWKMLAFNVVSGVSCVAAGKWKANRANKLAASLCNELVKVLWLFNRTFNKERVRLQFLF